MNTFKPALAGLLLAVGVISAGCVADRPSRNGVFNENQYVRKDFLIEGTDLNGQYQGNDPGWMMRATVMETSTPNLLGDEIGIVGGESTEASLVRFRVSNDKLQILDQQQPQNDLEPGPTGADTIPNNASVTETVLNAWPATNVDLKYRVNLDGEKTNFYEENQELDWQVRQWVKVSFDKNDLSDFAPLGEFSIDLVNMCGDVIDASATLVTDSFNVVPGSDPSQDYFEFTVQVTVPMTTIPSTPGDTTCMTAYGPFMQALTAESPESIGSTGGLNVRTNVTVNLKYSFMRAVPTANLTYVPFPIAEKDPIHRKYGPIMYTIYNIDNTTGLAAATQYVNRNDPTQPIVWYFDSSFPEYYKPIWVGTNGNPGIMQETNKLLAAAGAKATVTFLNYNDLNTYQDGQGPSRVYGDIRYRMIRWTSDYFSEDLWSAVTMPTSDPRTGQLIGENMMFNDGAGSESGLQEIVQRIDAFLQTVGASTGLQNGGWQTGSCSTGQTQQIVDSTVLSNHNAQSTLFVKMQQYLNLQGSDPHNNHLGPQDFVAIQDQDFYNAYFKLAPYETFGDPDMNQFVTREGGAGVYGPAAFVTALGTEGTFQTQSALIDSGNEPYVSTEGTQGVLNAAAFANTMRDATTTHFQMNLFRTVARGAMKMDPPGAFSLETVMEQDAQQCVNGQWETQAQYTQHIIDTFWQQAFWHEFGHAMGMDHNFMSSLDMPNFTTQRNAMGQPLTDANGNTLYNMYSASIMEYNSSPARLAWTQGWGNFDKGSITWMYSNNGPQPDDPAKDAQILANKNLSGQLAGSAAGQEYPYHDLNGFCVSGDPDCTAGQERAYLRCDVTHERYSPMCREGDLGVTPSQIIANDIDSYEWLYQWRNFRDYRKVWNESSYATAVSGFIVDTRRFLSQWQFDWSPGDLATTLYRIGVTPPAGAVSAVDYYGQLTQKFDVEMSKTNQMVAAFSEAIIQQSSGERPYATVYDKFYGDVTQQGIILDKYYAMQEFVGLWQGDNYDQNQAAGAYISSWGEYDFDDSYQSVAETSITSMIGSQYASYPYFIPTAVALFAQDTHNPAFLDVCQQNSSSGTGERCEAKDWIGGWVFTREQDLIDYFKPIAVTNGVCATFTGCAYDVTNPAIVSQSVQDGHFLGPDNLTYIYAYLPSRNNWVLARQDRNIVTYKDIQLYNTDIMTTKDDGTDGAYSVYEYPIKYTIDSYTTYEDTTTGN
jgi:hypothetical protein